ncbi:MAG: hypothetical protein ACUZ8H_02095 [Candidatus Anammoxibacter sp.]
MDSEIKELAVEHKFLKQKVSKEQDRHGKFSGELAESKSLQNKYEAAVLQAQSELNDTRFDNILDVASTRTRLTEAKAKHKSQKQKIDDIEMILLQSNELLPELQKQQDEVLATIAARLATETAKEIKKVAGQLITEYHVLYPRTCLHKDALSTDLGFMAPRMQVDEVAALRSRLLGAVIG